MSWFPAACETRVLCSADSDASAASTSTTSASDGERPEDFGTGSLGSMPWPGTPLHSFFSTGDVQKWENGRFRMEKTLRESSRMKGGVDHMYDATMGIHVDVKRLPNDWICECHELFSQRRAESSQQPWVDIGCTAFLTSVGFGYVPPLLGVFRDSEATRIVTEHATEGDLLDFCTTAKDRPGQAREALMRPVALQIMRGVQILHDLGIVHGDICMENIVVSRDAGDGALQAQLVNFGMASSDRYTSGTKGRPSYYQAPETHSAETYDGFLVDAFSVGVVLFGMLTLESPWMSTQPGQCKAFEFFRSYGFRAFAVRRKCFQKERTLSECVSASLTWVLEGLLRTNPEERLTLGESAQYGGEDRRSVWDEPWVRNKA